jgi:DMSO/TMAO reductase YedYZ heme-binding membrane subunit
MFRQLLLQGGNPVTDLINKITTFINELTASTLLLFSAASIFVGLLGTFATVLFIGWKMVKKMRNEGLSIGEAAGTMVNSWVLLIIFLMLLASPLALLALTGDLQNIVNSFFSYFL